MSIHSHVFSELRRGLGPRFVEMDDYDPEQFAVDEYMYRLRQEVLRASGSYPSALYYDIDASPTFCRTSLFLSKRELAIIGDVMSKLPAPPNPVSVDSWLSPYCYTDEYGPWDLMRTFPIMTRLLRSFSSCSIIRFLDHYLSETKDPTVNFTCEKCSFDTTGGNFALGVVNCHTCAWKWIKPHHEMKSGIVFATCFYAFCSFATADTHFVQRELLNAMVAFYRPYPYDDPVLQNCSVCLRHPHVCEYVRGVTGVCCSLTDTKRVAQLILGRGFNLFYLMMLDVISFLVESVKYCRKSPTSRYFLRRHDDPTYSTAVANAYATCCLQDFYSVFDIMYADWE